MLFSFFSQQVAAINKVPLPHVNSFFPKQKQTWLLLYTKLLSFYPSDVIFKLANKKKKKPFLNELKQKLIRI
jgi:hypothetical protein